MVRANLAEFKARMAYFVRLIKRGEQVVLCERNVPIATVVPQSEIVESKGKAHKRQLGQHRGKFTVPDEVWRPLTEKDLKELFGDAF